MLGPGASRPPTPDHHVIFCVNSACDLPSQMSSGLGFPTGALENLAVQVADGRKEAHAVTLQLVTALGDSLKAPRLQQPLQSQPLPLPHRRSPHSKPQPQPQPWSRPQPQPQQEASPPQPQSQPQTQSQSQQSRQLPQHAVFPPKLHALGMAKGIASIFMETRRPAVNR